MVNTGETVDIQVVNNSKLLCFVYHLVTGQIAIRTVLLCMPSLSIGTLISCGKHWGKCT